MNEQTIKKILRVVLYVFSFLVLWEWIRPLETISDIANSHYFIIFLVFMLAADFFSVKWLWKWSAALIYIVVVSYILYYEANPMFGSGGLTLLIGDFINSIIAVIRFEWNDVTNSFRTFLFFLLLWMMTYLLQYWLIVRKRILLLILLSITFIATLDTFTQYDGDWAIVRLFMVGVTLLGVLRLLLLIEKEGVAVPIKVYYNWLIPLGLLAFTAMTVGLMAPKPAAQWPDPVPFLITNSNKFISNEEKTNKVGYSEDDTRLGGDFTPDNTLVFWTMVAEKHYWYVESKDNYTGFGWEVSDSIGEEGEMPFTSGTIFPYMTSVNENLELSDPQFDYIKGINKDDHIPYPNPSYNGMIIPEGSSDQLILDIETNKLTYADENSYRILSTYEAHYQVPTFHIDDLRAAGADQINQFYPESDFTQLPENLPERVKELAESITKDKTNMYDKVKAIEDYFHSPDYLYSREDIPYPDEDEDFVDQFLFETKRGYCDHFSTSMVVMLRTLDIPARWVKGYTAGEYVRYQSEFEQYIYEVTNNNAHSWVEVYFNGFGWIPFEPTKGYDLNLNIERNTTATPADDPRTPEEPRAEQPKQEQTEKEEKAKEDTPEQSKQDEKSDIKISESLKNYITDHWKSNLIALVVLLLFIWLIYFFRGKWRPRFWIWRFGRSNDQETFSEAYAALLKELNRCGIKRKSEQTLRDYAQSVDSRFATEEMSELTMHYERVIYGNGEASEIWEKVKPLWKNVMKKTIT